MDDFFIVRICAHELESVTGIYTCNSAYNSHGCSQGRESSVPGACVQVSCHGFPRGQGSMRVHTSN